MKRLAALAACGLVLAPSTPALAWGSTTTGGVWPAKFNTHACLDRMAYAFLEKDPAFQGAKFPALADILAHEGADVMQRGPGPDAKGASDYSLHWYNPRNQEGHAPQGVAANYLPLAYGQQGREKAAAWAAHFLADAHVPYHINGEYAADLRAQVKTSPDHVVLSERVTGDRGVFGRSYNVAGVIGGSAHSEDFTAEAHRFLDSAGSDPKLDWFDPWFWNGSTDTASYVSSSHVLWEGLRAPECPSNPVSQYSVYWTGNPQTQFGDPTAQLTAAVGAFTIAMATDVRDNAAVRLNSAGVEEAMAAESIATLWRASFSALRTNALIKFDPTTLNDPRQTPVADIRGKLGNVAPETARQVQMRLRVVSGPCRVIDAREVQPYGDLPRSTVGFGAWKLQVAGACRLSVEAIGRYYNTPDLQLAWRNLTVSPPAAASPPSSDCNCKPGDMMCQTLCRHDPGKPPQPSSNPTPTPTPTRKHCTTPNCVEPVDEE
ncbi:hypothetical protein ACO2Q3_02890 [Caulobacter sp. KR2-114]|uniref:hypothetical protein n=1 Tax=Caulobacter sp. KR2-114 TaxID=3400912 RepID=UPI003C08BD07